MSGLEQKLAFSRIEDPFYSTVEPIDNDSSDQTKETEYVFPVKFVVGLFAIIAVLNLSSIVYRIHCVFASKLFDKLVS